MGFKQINESTNNVRMALPAINPITTNVWKQLKVHFDALKDVKMQQLFREDDTRVEKMNIKWKDFYVDFSKNIITTETLSLLVDLAKEVKLKEAISLQFEGAPINETEGRAVLHTALRNFSEMKPEVKKTLQQMKGFSDE